MKKIVGLVLTLATVVTLGACGSSEAKTDGSSAKSEDALTKIKDAGVLKVGTSADFSPFEFHTMVDGKDKIVGADVDMVNAIADELGVDVEFMDMEFNAVLSSLQQGKVDIAVSGISATPERAEVVDFSTNYYNPPQKVVINKKNAAQYTSIDSLADKKVGAQKGSIQEAIVAEQLPDSEVVSVAKVPNLVIELNQGSIDALVVEETVGASYIAQNSDLEFADIELESDETQAYAIAMPKGSKGLQKEIDAIVTELDESGKIEEFVQKNIDLANESAK